jgi:hypothetical protein
MNITGPDCYSLTLSPSSFTVLCERGTQKFSGLAVSRKPKLYVVSAEHKPIYVGITKQPIRNRLRLGWNATGKTGYYGYAWRHIKRVSLSTSGPMKIRRHGMTASTSKRSKQK